MQPIDRPGLERASGQRPIRHRGRWALVSVAAVVFSLAAAALAASTNFVQPASSPEPVGAIPVSVAPADLDGDGDQDLAVANVGPDNVTILRNNGAGNFFQPASSPEATGPHPEPVVAADLDGDGDQDLAAANGTFGNVTILRNNGAGNFFQPASSPEPVGDGPAIARRRRPRRRRGPGPRGPERELQPRDDPAQ